jgi:hypothetical protein
MKPLDLNWMKEKSQKVDLLKSSERSIGIIQDDDISNLLSKMPTMKRQ